MKILVFLVLLGSCSSIKKSFVYGGLAGGSIGVIAGNVLSPNQESKAPNMAVWGSVGALIGAGLSYYFYKDDPENRELPNMILPSTDKVVNLNGKINNTIILPADSKKYQIETSPLPDHLKGKVQKPFIIEHEIPEQVQSLKNGKSITIEAHKAWEVTYE
jgi:hypothetical protein